MLVQAVKEDNQAMVEELVSQGEDVTRKDDVGQVYAIMFFKGLSMAGGGWGWGGNPIPHY